MDFSKYLDLLKQPARVLFSLGIVGVLVLALPDRPAALFGFAELRSHFRPWVGLPTLLTVA